MLRVSKEGSTAKILTRLAALCRTRQIQYPEKTEGPLNWPTAASVARNYRRFPLASLRLTARPAAPNSAFNPQPLPVGALDHRPADSRAGPPIATYALLAINIVIFVAMVASGISFVTPETGQVLRWGADYGPYTLSGQYWRLITSMFLHFGIIHIFGNMWCLWSLGRLAEKMVGSLSLVGIYLMTGVGASLLSLSWDPMRVSAGASGAIFGIAGALISVLYFGSSGFSLKA